MPGGAGVWSHSWAWSKRLGLRVNLDKFTVELTQAIEVIGVRPDPVSYLSDNHFVPAGVATDGVHTVSTC